MLKNAHEIMVDQSPNQNIPLDCQTGDQKMHRPLQAEINPIEIIARSLPLNRLVDILRIIEHKRNKCNKNLRLEC